MRDDHSALSATPIMTLKSTGFDGTQVAIRDGVVPHYGTKAYRYEEPFIELYQYEACTSDMHRKTRVYLGEENLVSLHSTLARGTRESRG